MGDQVLNFNKINNNTCFWNFIEINIGIYIIKNKNNCYIKISNYKICCDNISIEQATQFKILRIFSERKKYDNAKNAKLLNEEPIDILIKYINLRDPKLHRNGIYQIEKDYDNEELRYSIRSILTHIPWVRKIYILMPNEKVSYFKDYNFINEKIIYIKDKDFLGYDSSNCNAFLFRYWKMKYFGISDNIIIMDDDYFIGSNLEKSDFFYVKNGKVVPTITTSNFIKIDHQSVDNNINLYEKKAKIDYREQNNEIFLYSKYLTYKFILNIFNISFNDSVYIPSFTHNAIPINLKESKEIYDLVYISNYRYNTLDCIYRISGYLLFQLLIQSFTFLKYKRRIKNIPSKFIQLNDSISANYKYSLFCINKGAGNYTYINFYKAKIIMEHLFPKPSPYEIVDYSLSKYAFNLTFSMDKIINKNEMKISHMITKKTFYYFHIKLILIFIFTLIKIYNNYYIQNYN